LRHAAVDEQFDPRDVAGVVRSEKNRRLGDLIRPAVAAGIIRRRSSSVLEEANSSFSPDVSIEPGLIALTANAALFQVRRPGPRK
jgi:hypothetical protein